MKDGYASDAAEIGLAHCDDLGPEHFDGHTEFNRMGQEERLVWLSETALFIHSVREWRKEQEGCLPQG